MTPRTLIATARIPGGDDLRLFQRGDDFMIVLDRNELMNSRMSGSEEALAVMTCARLGHMPAPRILIGGYGMGFTLRAALAVLPAHARIDLVELVPAIIDWARGPMATLTAGGLDDPRLDLRCGDVVTTIETALACYDAILLDVDNGPDGLSCASNDRLYSAAGIARAKAALACGGILAVWSAAPDAKFSARLKAGGFTVEQATVRARSNGKGPRHVVWFASKP